MTRKRALNTKTQVEKYAKELGVTVDDLSVPGDYYDICLMSPKGIRLKSTGHHSAVTHFSVFEGTKADAWKDVGEDLSYGVEECDEPNCGYCERGEQNV